MKVFISWSGSESEKVAEILRDWLPCVLQATRPWMSKEDIRKGGRGGQAIADALRDAKAGIICVTPSNQDSPWLNFESGAISKTLDDSLVCTFLRGLKPSEVKPPLAQFQHTQAAVKEDVLRMLGSINKALEGSALSEATLGKTFDQWWSDLEGQLAAVPQPAAAVPRRTELEMLEELLSLARDEARVRQAQRELERRIASIDFHVDQEKTPRSAGRPASIRQLLERSASSLAEHERAPEGAAPSKIVILRADGGGPEVPVSETPGKR